MDPVIGLPICDIHGSQRCNDRHPNPRPQAGEGGTRAEGAGGWGLLSTRQQRAMTVSAKICGLSSEAGVAAAVEGGAAYLGFVFYPPSPRAVSPARAAALCAAVPAGVRRVGMFV